MKRNSYIWHPMTQHGLGVDEIHVTRAEGAYLYAGERRIIDAISSWWVVTHGHCHPRIVEAVRDQAGELSQIIFAGLTHEPAKKLAAALLEITDPHLRHVFYSDSGSTAVEVAIKMAVGAHKAWGRPRYKVLALEGGYHGDTFGAMSAGGRGVFTSPYEPMLFETVHVPLPSAKGLADFKALIDTRGHEFAAFIFEPLVQGSAGMRMYDAGALRGYADICRDAEILLIADEVMTGFGRTGAMFACDKADVTPDLMCLSKGLTGGFLPMGVTLASADIYGAFYSDNRGDMFMHSTSFTANPLACVAAFAALQIWDEEDTQGKIDQISVWQAAAARRFGGRSIGTILALDISAEDGYLSKVVPRMMAMALERDVLLRPIGNVIYVLPPYCVSRQDLEKTYDVIAHLVSKI
jgi:adenosylmethionine-8-amino-7-oxononanoate aminotransferase